MKVNVHFELLVCLFWYFGISVSHCWAAEELSSVVFNPRAAPTAETLFVELSAEQTGIVVTNNYKDPRMWGERYHEFGVGAIGTGVAIGDYDGDGLVDLFAVNKIESGQLFRNLGDWRFEEVTVEAGLLDNSGEWKQGAAFADVNNDGRLDLYVCRFGVPNQLFMNNGDGTFSEEALPRGLAVIDASGMAAFADYDRDGWLDVYIQTNLLNSSAGPKGQPDYLFRNRGDGTFEDVSEVSGISTAPTQGHSATWWDYDADGWLDLYVANDFAFPDLLYRNNGDGTFEDVVNQVLPHMPFSSMGTDLGDVDNDGYIDFLVADMAPTSHVMEQRGMADSRARMRKTLHEDLDTAIQIPYNALYLGSRLNRSMEAAHLAGLSRTDWTWSVRFEDLNSDGLLDVFVTNGMNREQTNSDLVRRMMVAVSPRQRISIMNSSPVLREANLAYVNRGSLRFEEIGRQWGLDHVGVSFGTGFGDFDGDGDLDLVFTNYEEGLTVLRNESQEGENVVIALRGTESNRFGVGATVEAITKRGSQVRQLSLARGYMSTSEPVLHFGFGDEESIERLKVTWPSGRVQLVDNLRTGRKYFLEEPTVNAVEKREIGNPQFVNVSKVKGLEIARREEKLEGTVRQYISPRRFNRRGPGIAVGDLDGDAVDEIVLGATVIDGTVVLKRDESRFRSLESGSLGNAPPIDNGPPLIFDANGDGSNDLLITAGGAALPAEEPEYEPRLWLNDGRGNLSQAPAGLLPSIPVSVGAVVAADFDRSGTLDLFIGGRLLPGYYPEAAPSSILMRKTVRFEDKTSDYAPSLQNLGLVTSALASDVDGDGWTDLVVALEWGSIRYFRNVEGRQLVDCSEERGFLGAGMGLWTSIACADFNADGLLDYALGNLGLNTPYQASKASPMYLFSGEFGTKGIPILIEAYEEDGTLFPRRSRAELEAKLSGVKDRFKSNDEYSLASLEEILGADRLANADCLKVTELRSGVLLSQPSGSYEFTPLPRLAQIAPVQGMVATDFDADGHSDLLIAHNDYSADPAVSRFDGGLGLFLRGNGKGDFLPVLMEESGWLVPGNAKSLAIADLNGDAYPDVVVTRNNSTTLAFENVGREGAYSGVIKLRGRAGNVDAIGARVSFFSEGQVIYVAEVGAGGGFGSQSTTQLFFAIPKSKGRNIVVKVRWPSGKVYEALLLLEKGRMEISE